VLEKRGDSNLKYGGQVRPKDQSSNTLASLFLFGVREARSSRTEAQADGDLPWSEGVNPML